MVATAMKPKLGDRRYLAVWCDAGTLQADATSNGWNPDGDVGPLDYTDHGDHEVYLVCQSFDVAVKIAHSKQADDFFNCPRVYLQEFGPADVPAGAREWEDVKFWDIESDGTAVEQSI